MPLPPLPSILPALTCSALTATKSEKLPIKTGLITGELVEVLSGLNEGDVIVARAGTFLREGDIVRPILPDAKVSEVK